MNKKLLKNVVICVGLFAAGTLTERICHMRSFEQIGLVLAMVVVGLVCWDLGNQAGAKIEPPE
jgi:uncharacterized membrane protein